MPADVEWIGGIEPMPPTRTGGATEISLWLGPEGHVIDFRVGAAGTLLEHAAEHLHATRQRAEREGAERPTRLRVRSPELAALLGASDTPVTCAATPELEAVVAQLARGLSEDEPSYLSVDIEPKHVASFFAAAARLVRAEPWRLPPDARTRTTEQGAPGAVVTVVGQSSAQLALVIFPDQDAFRTFLDAPADVASMPPHTSLSFVTTAALNRVLAEEIALWGWQLASPAAVPQAVVVAADGSTRAPTLLELATIEAAMRTVERLCEDAATSAQREKNREKAARKRRKR